MSEENGLEEEEEHVGLLGRESKRERKGLESKRLIRGGRHVTN